MRKIKRPFGCKLAAFSLNKHGFGQWQTLPRPILGQIKRVTTLA
jgi:hypothetical protein